MKNIIIIHGAYGSPKENWIPWLKEKLEKNNCNVVVPKFSTPEGQSLDNWLKTFKEYHKYLDEGSILVGHSIGVAFILNLLERIDTKIKACFLISGFVDLLDNSQFDKINKTFTNKRFNWQKIKDNCNNFHIFHSDNDPYVPLDKSQNIADKFKIDIDLIKNGGHLNKEAGYTKFQQLLDKILEEIY